MTARGDGVETCKACGSGNLWGNEVDDNDDGNYAHGLDGGRWTLLCQDCGQDQDRPVKIAR